MGSNEKGMRHDNSKILGFGLLALAAVLVLRKTKAQEWEVFRTTGRARKREQERQKMPLKPLGFIMEINLPIMKLQDQQVANILNAKLGIHTLK